MGRRFWVHVFWVWIFVGCSPTAGQFAYTGPPKPEPWIQVIAYPESPKSNSGSIAQTFHVEFFQRPILAMAWVHNPTSAMVQITILCRGWKNEFPPGMCIKPMHTQPLPLTIQQGWRFDEICVVREWSHTITECSQ